MGSDNPSEPVEFITIQDGDDLIVSFAISGEMPGDVESLTLLRTPKYDVLRDASECGVNVSHERFPAFEDDLLLAMTMTRRMAFIETTSTRYELDLTGVEREELKRARRVLRRMNFERRFRLDVDLMRS